MSNHSEKRGIVINPGVFSHGTVGNSLANGPVFDMLRRCILYWDVIDWPRINLIALRIGPTEALLTRLGDSRSASCLASS